MAACRLSWDQVRDTLTDPKRFSNMINDGGGVERNSGIINNNNNNNNKDGCR